MRKICSGSLTKVDSARNQAILAGIKPSRMSASVLITNEQSVCVTEVLRLMRKSVRRGLFRKNRAGISPIRALVIAPERANEIDEHIRDCADRRTVPRAKAYAGKHDDGGGEVDVLDKAAEQVDGDAEE